MVSTFARFDACAFAVYNCFSAVLLQIAMNMSLEQKDENTYGKMDHLLKLKTVAHSLQLKHVVPNYMM